MPVAWRRLAGALGVSLAAHLLLLGMIGPAKSRQIRTLPLELRLAPEPRVTGSSMLTTDRPSASKAPRKTADRQRPDPAPPAATRRIVDPDPELARQSRNAPEIHLGASLDELRAHHLFELPLPPEIEYLTPDMLEKRAELLGELPLEYPMAGAIAGGRGTIVLRVLIEETGDVGGVQVVSANADELYAELARQAFLAARFTPAMKDGRPVKSQKTVEVNFAPD